MCFSCVMRMSRVLLLCVSGMRMSRVFLLCYENVSCASLVC